MTTLLSLMVTIFVLTAVGFLSKKIHLVNASGQKSITDLVIYVVLPCNILKAFMTKYTSHMLTECMAVLLISVVIQVFSVIYGRIIFRKEPEGRRKCLQYGIICPNGGFLGNPIAEGVFGSQGLLLASFFLIPQRIMMWTSGLATFSGTSDKKATLRRVCTHPCILACVAGTVILLTQVNLPQWIVMPVTALGNCNTALSMMVIGMILAEMDPKSFLDKTSFVYTIHRLVILPALILLFCKVLQALGLPVDSLSTGVCTLLTAMPAGATTSILAEKYGMEPEFATRLVILSTLFSLPAICIWSMILT